MPQIVLNGSVNSVAALVPDLYVNLIAPPLVLSGAPTNVLGLVGSASWGPVGRPVAVGDPSSYAAAFGPVQARKYDAGTAVDVAALQGANVFTVVRVSDGTDTHASVALPAGDVAAAPTFYAALSAALNAGSGVARGASAVVSIVGETVTARYTGTVGSGITLAIGAGSKVGTFRATVSRPSHVPELFDNLPAAGAAPAIATYALVGGTDGATGVTAAMMIGSDVYPRTGMYALRGTGCAVAMLADLDDSTTFTTQAAFGYGEGIYMVLVGPQGQSISDAAAAKAAAGLDDFDCVVLLGDWPSYNDATNQVTRMVSPQAFLAGKRVALTPNDSVLNKELRGIVSSQRVGAYTEADLQALVLAGIEVICNPAPGGAYWACRIGHNSSSVATEQSDSYTMMSFFLARTFVTGGMGRFVGKPLSTSGLRDIQSTLMALGSTLQSQGLIGGPDGSVAYKVVCSVKNNPNSRTALGYGQADVSIQYQGINEKFFVNLEGGASVSIGK